MQPHIDTIVAIATPLGRGGIAVVRVSGPLVPHIIQTILKKSLIPRYATFSLFLDENDHTIDEGIALFFPGPHSFTGEDVLELQGHGGAVVVDCLVRRIIACGARLAKPGEFSERAFLNDKLDLAQAEAIADLIDASSEQAARSAIRSLQGEFSERIHFIVNQLIHLRTYVEAAMDFAEEEIDFLADQQILMNLQKILTDLQVIQAVATQGSLLRDGITVVIAGEPNVGKSSLINCLSGKDVAIVTDIAGTTRDVLREHIVMDGLPIHIIDTAGLRESTDVVEQEGIRRAHVEINRADFILFVCDVNNPSARDLEDFVKNIPERAEVIIIKNKIDLLNEIPEISTEVGKTAICLSAKNGSGIDLLKQYIKEKIGLHQTNEGIFSARRRHLDAIARAKTFLQNAETQLIQNRAGELMAEDLRQAQSALNEITGEFSSDDLLGRIFSSFCIGK